MRAHTGEKYEIRRGTTHAVIGSLAAVIRSLEVDGVALCETFADDALPPLGCGIVLVPWPNRVRDGRWILGGEPQQLDITEPSRGNASHGLLRNTEYELRDRTDASLTLGANIFPQHGFPFVLDTWVRYEALPDGIRVTHGVTNLTGRAAPYAVGAHPFFRIGEVPVEELTLTLRATSRILVDDRSLPIGTEDVPGTAYDYANGVRVGDLDVDVAFAIEHGSDDESARLTAPDGSTLVLWQGDDWGHLHIFTPHGFARADGPGLAIALEPLTAPADALNSGTGLRWLESGEHWQGAWGVRYSRPV